MLTQVINMWYKEFRKVYSSFEAIALSAKNKWEYYTISKSFLWSTWLYHCLLLLLFMLAFLFNFKQFCKVCKTLEGILALHIHHIHYPSYLWTVDWSRLIHHGRCIATIGPLITLTIRMSSALC